MSIPAAQHQKNYFENGDLWFPEGTLSAVREALHRAYTANRTTHGRGRRGTRIRLWYGSPETGRDWCEEHDVVGYVSRTTGSIKVPVLIYNDRSLGGPAITCENIVRIDWCDGTPLYRHPNFQSVLEEAYVAAPVNGRWSVCLPGGAVHATFDTRLQAEKWIDFMTGKRYRK
jgi:hypothetical protein